MAEKKSVALGLVCIFLAVGLIGSVMILNQTEEEVQIKSEELVEIENEKGTLEIQVTGLQSEKATLETQVTDLQSETTELNKEVSGLESNVSSLQSEVATLETEVAQSYNSGYAEGESDGYQSGFDEGYSQGIEYLTKNGFYIRDPTYEEAIEFIDADKTDENHYSPDYVCYDFTADFNKNAEDEGYRCGFVYITFSDSAHAIACFYTTDEGLIYIEPQTDEIVTPAVGQPHQEMDIIEGLGIIW
jgi:hypothetical protein